MPTFWDELKTIVQATWTEVADGALKQDVAREHDDWVVLINTGKMVPPWVVVTEQIEATDEWIALPCVKVTVTIYYITSLKAARDASKTAVDFIQGKLFALRTALLDAQTIGTVDEHSVAIDTTADNPINTSMLTNKVDYQAGSILFEAITGV